MSNLYLKVKNVKCPHCAVLIGVSPVSIYGDGIYFFSAPNPITGFTQAKARVEIEAVAKEDKGYGEPTWGICECVNCHRLFAIVVDLSGKISAVFPLPRRPVPKEIPEPVRSAFEDALICLAAGGLGGCLMMCRTTMERTWREQEVSNLTGLRDKGTISQKLCEQSNEVRHWADMVTHDDILLDAVTHETVEELVDYVESLMDAVYVQPAKLAKHRQTRKDLKSNQ